MLPRYTRVLLRCLQDVQADNVIMTCNTSRAGATARATVHCRASDHLRARLAEATTRQDESYVVDHTPHGRIDKTGCVGCRLHHHYTKSAFNALDTI
jgi:hypothetical protein